VNGAEQLKIVASNAGTASEGIVWLDVKEGERTSIEVEFDEPYSGPIEAKASAREAEIET
jgi:hypothetical protein